jgi:LDH2 family malate/lactate/ureidoglycolate dehydrogenase
MPQSSSPPHLMYGSNELRGFITSLFDAAGAEHQKSAAIAHGLLEAELFGHSTHGIGLVLKYLSELQSGSMKGAGEVETLRDNGSCICWNGRQLPGLWLVREAIDLALKRVPTYGIITIVVRQGSHIGALSSYLQRATDDGCIVIVATSNPGLRRVAGFGGIDPVISQNPIGIGIPTSGNPILIDMSTSIVSGGQVLRAKEEGKQLAGRWLIDSDGNPSGDPSALFDSAVAGAIMPLGGLDYGFKGMGLGLTVEALTGALGGWGRSRAQSSWPSNVFIQVIDPEAFGGTAAFIEESDFLAAAFRDSRPINSSKPVRVPGDRAFQSKVTRSSDGIPLSPLVVEALASWARSNGVSGPVPTGIVPDVAGHGSPASGDALGAAD